jgi:hypothetical protein
LAIEVGEMENQEVIIVVDIDFRALVDRLTVFNVEGVKMETIFEKFKVLVARIVEMTPCNIADFETVNHTLSSPKKISLQN